MEIYAANFIIPIDQAPIRNAAIVIEKGSIIEIGEREIICKKYPDTSPHILENALLMPGLINSYTSLENKAFVPGVQPDLQFDSYIQWIIALSQYKSQLSPEQSATYIQEGLKKQISQGVTCLVDASSKVDSQLVYHDSKLRVIALLELLNLEREQSTHDFHQVLSQLDLSQDSPYERVQSGIAPFTAFTLSVNFLRILAQYARGGHLPFYIHAAAAFTEMEFFYYSHGEIVDQLFPYAKWDQVPRPHQITPIQYLREIGLLSEQTCITGAIQLGATDLDFIKHEKSSIILGPSSFNFIDFGEIPYNKIQQSGVNWALGNFGAAWRSENSLWNDLRLVAKQIQEQKLSMSYDDLLRKVTLDAAKCLNKDTEIGSLSTGKQADFIWIDCEKSEEISEAKLAQKVIENTSSEKIKGIWVGGERIDELKLF